MSADDGIQGRELWAVSVSDFLANRTPFAANDSFSTNQNTSIIISTAALLANDADLDGDNLFITAFTQSRQGNLVNNNDSTYTYIPAENYYGLDRFTYTISDGQGNTSTATVNLTVNQFPAVLNQPYSVTATNSILRYASLRNLTNINGVLYFTANNDSGRTFFLRIDNTTGKVVQVVSFDPVEYPQPENITNVNGTFYFTTFVVYGQGSALWRIDNNTGNAVEITNIRQQGYEYLEISYLTNVNGTLYFTTSSYNSSENSQLWRIDNNTGNAVRLTDINPDSDSSNLSNLTNVNGTLYFSANDGSNGAELWKIDNNTGNAVRFTDINPGSGSSNPRNLTNINGTLYLVANDGTSGDELWRIDNNTGNAVLVRDINPGSGSSYLYNLINANGTLYFVANDGTTGNELWKIDNSTGNAVLVRDINPGSDSSAPSNLTNVNGTLYFTANNGINGTELWRIDNNTGNAVLFKDINPGSGYSNPSNLINADGTLYFVADDGSNGLQLWQIENNTDRPVRITDINQGSGNSYPESLVYTDGILYFTYVNPSNYINGTGTQLLALSVTDVPNRNPIVENDTVITATNTPVIISVATLLANDVDADGDVLSVTSLSQPSHGSLVNNNDGTYTYTPNSGYYGLDSLTYTVRDGNGGTNTATVNLNISAPYPVRGIYPVGNVSTLFNFNDTLYFFVQRGGVYPSGGTIARLWRIDSTTNEAVALLPSDDVADRSSDYPIILNNRPYIITRDRSGYASISQVDISTGQIGQGIFFPSIDESTPPNSINGRIYFESSGFSNFSPGLLKIDENTGEFVVLFILDNGYPTFTTSNSIGDYDEVDGTLYYVIYTTTYEVDQDGNQTEFSQTSSLWRIDSLTGDSVRIIEINSQSDYPSLSNLTSVGDFLYFTASNDNFGRELWRINPTIGNPERVTDINPDSGDSTPQNLININDTLYFIANDGTTGNELWKIDSATGNPVRLTDINPGNGDSLVRQLFIFNDTLYFNANDGSTGTELWRIDSNTGNAVLVRDINPGSGSSNPSSLTIVDGTLYFIINSGSGDEVWKIDESTGNAVHLIDIFPEYEFTSVGIPTDINGRLYFTASNATYGNELWTIDESTGGLILLTDIINPGSESSNPTELTFANDSLYFRADSSSGYQLWALPVSNNQLINGTADADNLVGINQNEVINAGDGDDFVDGSGGNDTIDGGAGNGDRLFGANGNDTITDRDGVFAANGGPGNDRINVTFAANWDNNSNPNDAPRSDGKIIGGYGNDTITVTLNNSRFFINLKGDEPVSNDPRDGNDVVTLLGSYGNSVVDLGGGNDTFNGGVGADNVSGGDGNDILNGGAGNDLLKGGRGRDVLTGGAGRDKFEISLPLAGGFDRITDFAVADDKILISKSEFGLSQGLGVFDPNSFRLGASATTASDRLIYNQSTGNLFFDADGLGGNAQVRIAQLSNQAAINSTNISVIA